MGPRAVFQMQVPRAVFFFTPIGMQVFQNMWVANHLGFIGIRTCGSYVNVNAVRLYQYGANRY